MTANAPATSASTPANIPTATIVRRDMAIGPLPTVQGLFYGVVLAGIVSVGVIIWTRSMRGTIAYGPYLAAGALIMLFQGQ